jgi:hypothetical protein
MRSESPLGAGSRPPHNRCFDEHTVPHSYYVRRQSKAYVAEGRRGVSLIILYGQMAEKNSLFRFTIISSSSTGSVWVCGYVQESCVSGVWDDFLLLLEYTS